MFFLGNLASGGAAGATSLIFLHPIDFARIKLADDDKYAKYRKYREFNGIVDCLHKIYKSEGLARIYRGFAISAMGMSAYRATYFGIFDTGKVLIFKDHKKTNIFVLYSFA